MHSPSGTVTFLFTDVEGSTRLLEELGTERYAEALAEHRRLLREAFAANGGVEVDTQGDAFFFAFAEAGAALAAAAAGQRALARGPIHVRIGVHTGEALRAGGGYVGLEVHKAARVAATGHGGQVVVSEAARLASGRQLRSLGTHRLKDLLAPEPLWQLGEGHFPRPKSLNQTNLPVQPSPLIGRERELAELRSLVERSRVVTLVGPGGSGKTRLALQLAAELVDETPHGVWWVPLQALRDPALVVPTIASTLGAQGDLVDHLAGKRLLVLLDNMEQLVEAAPEVAGLVTATTELKLLVTSREPLHVQGEAEYAVEPLPDQDAVALFRERAAVSEPLEAVREICRRLDYLPLALELAAARTKLLPPEQLLARLEQRLPLLTGGRRDAPDRQRTLRATIEWSYELLTKQEQQLFARLSVFAGSFDVEAAEQVCDADLDQLQSLLDKNLIRRWGSGRLGMLETIREFAVERLDGQPDSRNARLCHGDYYLACTHERSPAQLRDWGGLTTAAAEWFDAEHTNVRAALEWFELADEPERELRLVLAMHAYWIRRGHWREGLRRDEGVLERAANAPPYLRAWASWGVCMFAWHLGDYTRAKLAAQQAARLFEEAHAPANDRAWAVFGLAASESTVGNFVSAAELYDEALGLARAACDEHLLGIVLNAVGNLALNQRDWARARKHFEESLPIARASGTPYDIANNLIDLSYAALAEHSVDGVAGWLHESLAICRAEEGIAQLTVWTLEGPAALAAERGDAVAAARLLAAASRIRDETGLGDMYPIGDEIRAETLAKVREKLDDSSFEREWATGVALTAEAAADEAALVD